MSQNLEAPSPLWNLDSKTLVGSTDGGLGVGTFPYFREDFPMIFHIGNHPAGDFPWKEPGKSHGIPWGRSGGLPYKAYFSGLCK